jgi:hypothetical protein
VETLSLNKPKSLIIGYSQMAMRAHIPVNF